MNHNKSYRKLGRRTDHRLAMMKNMTISLVNAERIETTVTRAKELSNINIRVNGKTAEADLINLNNKIKDLIYT